MTVYAVALFLHIVGALGLFAALALEWTALSGFRRSTTAEQVTDWSTIYGALRRIGPVSIGLLLVFGLYMMATAWGPTPWIGLGILALVVIAALGAFNGIQITRVLRQNAGRTGPLSSESRNALHRPTFVLSLRAPHGARARRRPDHDGEDRPRDVRCRTRDHSRARRWLDVPPRRRERAAADESADLSYRVAGLSLTRSVSAGSPLRALVSS